MPLVESAMTRIRRPAGSSRASATSPLWARAGAASRTPSAVTSRPSTPSPRVAPSTTDGSGSSPGPLTTSCPDSTRSSSWPNGSASEPVTSTSAPRDRAGASAGRRIAIPAVESWIAARDGVPRRPASAVTTPPIRSRLPTWYARASAIERRVRSGGLVGVELGDGVGAGVGDDVGEGEGSGGVGLGSGPVVGTGPGSGVALGDGVGVAARTTSSPGSVAWSR